VCESVDRQTDGGNGKIMIKLAEEPEEKEITIQERRRLF
jgi:hypothetical protein